MTWAPNVAILNEDGGTIAWAVPSYRQAAHAIGISVDHWAGQCHGISSVLVDKGLVPGVVRRGYYLGDCAPNAYFKSNFAQHSWIELPGGRVCDPTAHAFQLANSGTPDFRTPQPDELLPVYEKTMSDVLYDIGGCRMFAKSAGDPPSPGTVYEEEAPIMLETGAFQYIADLLGADSGFVYPSEPTALEVSYPQAMWLANLPILDKEGPRNLSRFFAAEVYEALCKAGHRAMIPIDRLDWILPDERKR